MNLIDVFNFPRPIVCSKDELRVDHRPLHALLLHYENKRLDYSRIT